MWNFRDDKSSRVSRPSPLKIALIPGAVCSRAHTWRMKSPGVFYLDGALRYRELAIDCLELSKPDWQPDDTRLLEEPRKLNMCDSPDPKKNQLLAALPEGEWLRWLPRLEAVDLALGEVLYESGKTLSHVYFPTTAIISLLYVMEDGASAEIAVVGNEGIVGISLFMGGESTPNRAVVQSGGRGYALPSKTIKDEFTRAPVLHLMLRYTQALITQMSQTAVCNRHHSLDQQLCRWLLLSLDRLEGDELVMTQELIANMLGVRREGVSKAALNLQKAGLIRYTRGRISVLNRAGLEQRSCECYAVVKNEYDRLLPPKLAT